MADKKKLIEHLKSVLIVLLLISCSVLLYHTGYYSDTFDAINNFLISEVSVEQNGEGSTVDIKNYGKSHVMEFSVSFSDGSMYGCSYDGEEVENSYGRFSAFLAEALGSSYDHESANEINWLKAIEGEGVYMRYFAPQSTELLAMQLGTELPENGTEFMADEFCLSVSDDSVYLYYRSGKEFVRCRTAVSASALIERINEFTPNGAFFSNSDSMLRGLAKGRLIVDKSFVPAVSSNSAPGMTHILNTLMPLLGMNEYTASHYDEANGTSVYIDSDSILRVSPSGSASCELNKSLSAESPELCDVVSFCSDIVSRSIGNSCGEAEVYLLSVTQNLNGMNELTFDYLINGIPLINGSDHAAKFFVDGAEIYGVEFNFRSYSAADGYISLLPMYQAAAVAAAEGSSGIRLCYQESPDGIICNWVKE